MNAVLRWTRWCPVWIALALAAGCVTTQPLSDADRAKVKSVKIKIQGHVPMYYMGPGTSILLSAGAVGGAVAGAASAEPKKDLQIFAESHGIFIDQIVAEALSSELRAAGKLTLVDAQAPADATLNVTITQWGFSVPHGFSSQLVPVLGLYCQMDDDGGKRLWRATGSVLPLGNPVEPQSLESMREDPNRIANAWRGAAKRAARDVLSTM